MKLFEWLVLAAVLMTAVVFVLPNPFHIGTRGASGKSQSRTNLKHLGLALHDHHDAEGAFPAGTRLDAEGRPLHGWMTALLPYVDMPALYADIDHDRPWDGVDNLGHFTKEVTSYLQPAFPRHRFDERGLALAHYSANSRVMLSGDRMHMHKIADGLTHTIFSGEVHDEFLPWGDPDNVRDPALGINRVPNGFGGAPRYEGAQFVFGDGAVHFLSKNVDPKVLRALATPNGGEDRQLLSDALFR